MKLIKQLEGIFFTALHTFKMAMTLYPDATSSKMIHLTSLHMLLDNSSLTTREVTVCSLIMIMLVTAIPPSNPLTSSSAYHKHLQALDLKLTCHPARWHHAMYQMFKWTERNWEFPKWVCVGLSKVGVWGFVVVQQARKSLPNNCTQLWDILHPLCSVEQCSWTLKLTWSLSGPNV